MSVTSRMEGVNLIGCAWNDSKRKLIVGTCGTTLPGSPHGRKRERLIDAGQIETCDKSVKRPRIVQLCFSAAPAVDVHNHYRQGALGAGAEHPSAIVVDARVLHHPWHHRDRRLRGLRPLQSKAPMT